MRHRHRGSEEKKDVSLQWPLTLAVVTLFVMLAFQSTHLLRERQALNDTRDGQATAYDESTKVRRQFEAIANGTIDLAKNGNENAKVIETALKNAGVMIKSPKTGRTNPTR